MNQRAEVAADHDEWVFTALFAPESSPRPARRSRPGHRRPRSSARRLVVSLATLAVVAGLALGWLVLAAGRDGAEPSAGRSGTGSPSAESPTVGLTTAGTAAAAFVGAIQHRDYPAARALLCATDRSDPAAFDRYWSAQTAAGRGITGFRLAVAPLTGPAAAFRARATVTLTLADGTIDTQNLPLSLTTGHWHACP